MNLLLAAWCLPLFAPPPRGGLVLEGRHLGGIIGIPTHVGLRMIDTVGSETVFGFLCPAACFVFCVLWVLGSWVLVQNSWLMVDIISKPSCSAYESLRPRRHMNNNLLVRNCLVV